MDKYGYVLKCLEERVTDNCWIINSSLDNFFHSFEDLRKNAPKPFNYEELIEVKS